MKLIKIRKGLYVPEDFDKVHAYFADSKGTKRYTGTTTALGVIAKPQIIAWAAKMAVEHMREYVTPSQVLGGFTEDEWDTLLEGAKSAHTKKKEAAGEYGTNTHALVEKYIKQCIEENGGSPHDKDLDEFLPIRTFINWAIESVDSFIFSERSMANRKHRLAGTADFACVLRDGRKMMGDFKTSSGIYGMEYWLQVAAYRLMAEAEGDTPYDGSLIVRLGKDGAFEIQERSDYKNDKKALLACIELYRAQANY